MARATTIKAISSKSFQSPRWSGSAQSYCPPEEKAVERPAPFHPDMDRIAGVQQSDRSPFYAHPFVSVFKKRCRGRRKNVFALAARLRIQISKQAFSPAFWFHDNCPSSAMYYQVIGVQGGSASCVHGCHGCCRQAQSITPADKPRLGSAGTTCAVRWACAADHHAS